MVAGDRAKELTALPKAGQVGRVPLDTAARLSKGFKVVTFLG
jgi:hypothetical protein